MNEGLLGFIIGFSCGLIISVLVSLKTADEVEESFKQEAVEQEAAYWCI